jgi:hypothetical protein
VTIFLVPGDKGSRAVAEAKQAAGAVIDNCSELTAAAAQRVRKQSGVLRLVKAERAKGLHTNEDDACVKYYTWKNNKGWLLHVLLRRDLYAEARNALWKAAGDRWGDVSYLLGGWSGRSRAGQGSPRPVLASECRATQRSVQLNDQRRVLRYQLPSHLYHSPTMASRCQQIEERIEQAVEFQVEQSESPRVTNLASLFDVPYQRLGRRLRGVDSRFTRAPTNKKLDNDQEAALITWLKRCEAL